MTDQEKVATGPETADSATEGPDRGANGAANGAAGGVAGYTTHVDDTDDEDITGGLSPDRVGGVSGYTARRVARAD